MVPQQILLLAAGGSEAGCLLFAQAGSAPILPGLSHFHVAGGSIGEGVEDRPVVGGVQQAALLELSLDLDQAVAQLAHQANARRLVIDKGAAAPIGAQQPAQHDGLAVAIETGLAQNSSGGMVASDSKFGGHRSLARAVAH